MMIFIRIIISVIAILASIIAYLAATGRIKIGILIDAREDINEIDKLNSP